MYMYPIRETIYISSQAALSRPFWHQSFSHQIFVLPEVRESFFSKIMLTWYRTCFAYRYTLTVSTCIVIIFMMKWEQLWWFSERIIVFFSSDDGSGRLKVQNITNDGPPALRLSPTLSRSCIFQSAAIIWFVILRSCNLGTWRGSAVTPDRTAMTVTRPRSICHSPQEAGGPAGVCDGKGRISTG